MSISPDISRTVVLSIRRVEIFTVFSLRHLCFRLRGRQILHQAETVPVYVRGILHDVNAFLDEMNSEASWPDLVEWATTQFLAISRSSAIYEHDLQARSPHSGPFPHAAAGHLNRLPRTASVRVPNNIRQRFVNCASHSAAFRLGKAQLLGKAHHCT